MKTCAFTGHRPQNLPWQFNENDKNCLKLKQILNQQISQLAEKGFTDFLSGMALGSDTWAAEAVLNLRKKNPALKLHCILPCKTQAEKWPVSEQERYQKILAQADSIFFTSRNYHPNCMLERNRFMVEKAHLLLAVYNGQPHSGTAAAVRHAQRLGCDIIIINPISLQIS
ncbi:MAG: DUF1273 domain-containing protein [Peptococcaceae bacterium]|jgi:uncharacterized phage-like protein YoqJ|nr:DUF1273 domain-containing protein [Peptococcaceae bacterium]